MTQRNRHAIRQAYNLSKSIRTHNVILIKLFSSQINKLKTFYANTVLGKNCFAEMLRLFRWKNTKAIIAEYLFRWYDCTLLTIARIFQLFAQLYAIFPSERIDCCWHPTNRQSTRYAFYSWKSKAVKLLSQTWIAIAFYTSDMTIVQRIVLNKEVWSTRRRK